VTGRINMGAGVLGRRKNRVAVLPILQELRSEAAAVMCAAFPGSLKRYVIPLLSESSITKARRGYACSMVYRHDLALLGLWAGGATREQGQLLADHAQGVVDRLWPVQEVDPRQMSLTETEAESEANPLQARYQGGDERVVPDLIARLRHQHAALGTFLRSLVAHSTDRGAA
jgi:hypothetical protein